MAYAALLDQIPPVAGTPRKIWSPNLFNTADGSYQIGNAGGGAVVYPAPFHYYTGSKVAQEEGQITWTGSGSVVEPNWYSGTLVVDPAFTALSDWFSTATKTDPLNWNSLVLTCQQACLVTLSGSWSLSATCPSPWIQTWQGARHLRGGSLVKTSTGGTSVQGGSVSQTASLSESFLIAPGDTLELSAATEPFGGGSTPTTTINDFHGTFHFVIAPLPEGTGILSATCANQAGGSNTSYQANAFDASITTDAAGNVPLLVGGSPLVLRLQPGASPTNVQCPVGTYYLWPPATVTGSKSTWTGTKDNETTVDGTFSLSPRPATLTVTAGQITSVDIQAGGFTS